MTEALASLYGLKQVQISLQPITGNTESIKHAWFNTQPAQRVEHNEDLCIPILLSLAGPDDEVAHDSKLIVSFPTEPVVMSPMQKSVVLSFQIRMTPYNGPDTHTWFTIGIIKQAPAYKTR